MNGKEKRLKLFWTVVLTGLTGAALCVNNDVYTCEQKTSRWTELLYKLNQAFREPNYAVMLVLVLIAIALWYLLPKMEQKLNVWAIPFSWVSAFMVLLCDSYYTYNSWKKVFGSGLAVALSAIKWSGLAALSYLAFQLMNLCWINQEEKKAGKRKWLLIFAESLLMFLCWLPYAIIQYPGNMCPDSSDEIAQVLGNETFCWTIKTLTNVTGNSLWNNHHPIFFTWIIQQILRVGTLISSNAHAIMLYGLLQLAILAFVLNVSFSYMRDIGVNHKVCRIVMILMILNPLLPLWGITITKDILFAVSMLCIFLLVYKLLHRTADFRKADAFGLFVFSMLLMMLRNNGFYLLLCELVILAIVAWKNKSIRKTILVSVLLPLLVFKVLYVGVFMSAMNIPQGSVREMLSVPFLQTARYVSEYQDEVTPEEEALILKVFKFDSLEAMTEAYHPAHADSIKNQYNKELTSDELKEYFGMWFSMFCKHPAVYIEAFLNLNYSWFYPDSQWDFSYYIGITTDHITEMLPGVKNPNWLEPWRNSLKYYVALLQKLPLISGLMEFSYYSWGYVILVLIMFIRKKWDVLVASVVMIMNYAICFIGPVAYTRYAFPMMLCFPFMLMLTLLKENKADNTVLQS